MRVEAAPIITTNTRPCHVRHHRSHRTGRWSGSLPGAPTANSLPLAAAISADLGVLPSSSAIEVSFVVAIDEKLSISWFGEDCPPYWRRALNQSDVPVQVAHRPNTSHVTCRTSHAARHPLFPCFQMLASAVSSCNNVLKRCDSFDEQQEELLTSAGGTQCGCDDFCR